jgi:hypothetical protein
MANVAWDAWCVQIRVKWVKVSSSRLFVCACSVFISVISDGVNTRCHGPKMAWDWVQIKTLPTSTCILDQILVKIELILDDSEVFSGQLRNINFLLPSKSILRALSTSKPIGKSANITLK